MRRGGEELSALEIWPVAGGDAGANVPLLLRFAGGGMGVVGKPVRCRRGGAGGKRLPHAPHWATSSLFSALQNGQKRMMGAVGDRARDHHTILDLGHRRRAAGSFASRTTVAIPSRPMPVNGAGGRQWRSPVGRQSVAVGRQSVREPDGEIDFEFSALDPVSKIDAEQGQDDLL
jgi:hypothetical protein